MTNLCGFFAFCVAAFPTVITHGDHGPVGIFRIKDTISMYFHLGSAFLFFILLAVNSIFLFTKSGDGKVAGQKKKRNVIYRLCGYVILGCLALLIVYVVFLQKTPITNAKPVLILEAIALVAFGFSWLVKGDTLFRDKPEGVSEKPADGDEAINAADD